MLGHLLPEGHPQLELSPQPGAEGPTPGRPSPEHAAATVWLFVPMFRTFDEQAEAGAEAESGLGPMSHSSRWWMSS